VLHSRTEQDIVNKKLGPDFSCGREHRSMALQSTFATPLCMDIWSGRVELSYSFENQTSHAPSSVCQMALHSTFATQLCMETWSGRHLVIDIVL
jgi:hypothetical protein